MDSWTRHRDFFSKGDPGIMDRTERRKIFEKEILETRRRRARGE
jgi:hypothetical protein